MEFAINAAYTNGEVDFKSAALKKETTTLFKEMGKSKKSFCTAAKALEKIRDEKLFEEDFLDSRGKPSFAEYCEVVLNISKSKAYSIIKTANNLLIPEIVTKDKDEYFSQFSESNLGILASVGTYDETKEFCERHNVDETTTAAELRKLIKSEEESKNNTESNGDGEGGEVTVEKPARKTAKDDLINLVTVLLPKATQILGLFDDETEKGIFLDIMNKYRD